MKDKMTVTHLDRSLAEKTIRIKDSNYCLSFVTLVWKGELIMCCYNNISKNISELFTSQLFEAHEFDDLEDIIGEYIFGEAYKYK